MIRRQEKFNERVYYTPSIYPLKISISWMIRIFMEKIDNVPKGRNLTKNLSNDS